MMLRGQEGEEDESREDADDGGTLALSEEQLLMMQMGLPVCFAGTNEVTTTTAGATSSLKQRRSLTSHFISPPP